MPILSTVYALRAAQGSRHAHLELRPPCPLRPTARCSSRHLHPKQLLPQTFDGAGACPFGFARARDVPEGSPVLHLIRAKLPLRASGNHALDHKPRLGNDSGLGQVTLQAVDHGSVRDRVSVQFVQHLLGVPFGFG